MDMNLHSPLAVLEPYVDIRFNIWFAVILVFIYGCAILNRRLLLLAVLAASAVILVFDTTATLGEMIKTTCLLPLGLGSVLAFLIASRSFQQTFLPQFTNYINFAVYGNIIMMVGTPTGGTIRGLCSKVTCVTLFMWILKQGRRARWKTVALHDDLFIFTAVSKPWIFAHAIYRFVLLTLPCFGSGRRHRLLEVYSLALTYALSSTYRLPFQHCFGMADTLVVPAIAAWSSIATTFDLIPRDIIQSENLEARISHNGDLFLSTILLCVAAYAGFKMAAA